MMRMSTGSTCTVKVPKLTPTFCTATLLAMMIFGGSPWWEFRNFGWFTNTDDCCSTTDVTCDDFSKDQHTRRQVQHLSLLLLDSKFRSITLHSLIVTGPTSKMVVTLSKKAERKAVRRHIITVKYHKFPFDCLYVLIATYSKNPENVQ